MPFVKPIDPYHPPVVGWWEDLGLSNLDEEFDADDN
jgi:hypothetical protein